MHKNFDPEQYKDQLSKILEFIDSKDDSSYEQVRKILSKHRKDDGNFFSKDELVAGYHHLIEQGVFDDNSELLEKIRMKPTRTMSGVTTVTVLTKPYPCPGNCIFCPDDVRMPKSYLSDEPGAQRAEKNLFDPYLQTYNRLVAIRNIGHNTDKIELIILGGTWSYYPEEYQIWFIKECFRALNDFGSNAKIKEITPEGYATNRSESATWEELFEQHRTNETADSRCIGLVVETRPDHVTEEEVIRIRKLGATKVQIGIQSLDDEILAMNGRGHTVSQTIHAIKLLRMAGFKIHAHWMANLYGSTVEKDIADYKKLWEEDIQPDELKLYPTSIIEGTILNKLYQHGKYKPYTHEELLQVITEAMKATPRYCRITRVIRDIPSDDIVYGNKYTNFRQMAEQDLIEKGQRCQCIRCREIRGSKVEKDDLAIEIIEYKTVLGRELFISYKTISDDKIVGFLRLSLPKRDPTNRQFIDELIDNALIREVHVYGVVVGIGEKEKGRSQHLGLGKKLIQKAEEIAQKEKFSGISVISAIGTREYYKKLGYGKGSLYLTKTFDR